MSVWELREVQGPCAPPPSNDGSCLRLHLKLDSSELMKWTQHISGFGNTKDRWVLVHTLQKQWSWSRSLGYFLTCFSFCFYFTCLELKQAGTIFFRIWFLHFQYFLMIYFWFTQKSVFFKELIIFIQIKHILSHPGPQWSWLFQKIGCEQTDTLGSPAQGAQRNSS